MPAGRTTQRTPITELGISSQARVLANGMIEVLIGTRRFAWGVRLTAPGFLADDAYFGIEPGGQRRIVLSPLRSGEAPPSIAVTAINAEGRVPVAVERIA